MNKKQIDAMKSANLGIGAFPEPEPSLLVKGLKALANVVYSDTSKAIAAQGATEIANALFSGSAYAPIHDKGNGIGVETTEAPKIEKPSFASMERQAASHTQHHHKDTGKGISH